MDRICEQCEKTFYWPTVPGPRATTCSAECATLKKRAYNIARNAEQRAARRRELELAREMDTERAVSERLAVLLAQALDNRPVAA